MNEETQSTSAAHSSGPWWVTPSGVRNSGGYIFHTNPVQYYHGQDKRYVKEVAEREADRRLGAAAPDLLEACETFAHWLATEENHDLMPDFYARVELCNLAQQQVRAALAKATGAARPGF